MTLIFRRTLLTLGALGVTLLVGCGTVAPQAPRAQVEPAVALAAWADVLTRFVNDRGEVDFPALAAQRERLAPYLRHIAATPLDSMADPHARLAHMINAYNALSMATVVDSGIPETHAGFNKVTFFVGRKMNVGGEDSSLYDFENYTIRPLARSLGLPEVHFALNCSAVSCPVLPRVPFTGENLKAELAREAKLFFAQPDNFRVDAVKREVWLSAILDFYTADFVPDHGHNLIAYANRHVAQPAPPDYAVRFTPYNWRVANSARR